MKFKCEEVEQITVSLENRPGVLADMCAYLADRRVNLRAVAALETAGADSGRIIVDDPEPAKQALSEAGVSYSTTKCLAIEMPNNPGGLAGISRTLSLAGINIDFIYASATSAPGRALGIFGVSDLERALTLDWEG